MKDDRPHPCAQCGSIWNTRRFYVGDTGRRYLCGGCANVLRLDYRVSTWKPPTQHAR